MILAATEFSRPIITPPDVPADNTGSFKKSYEGTPGLWLKLHKEPEIIERVKKLLGE
jgi:hypothetical protein